MPTIINGLVALSYALTAYASQVSPPIQQVIVTYAEQYGLNSQMMLDIADCESAFKTDVYGDKGLAYGVYQFHRATFDHFKQEARLPELDYYNPEDQIHLASWAFAHGKKYHWTCTKLMGYY